MTDRGRLAETRRLAESFARHHPGQRLAALVVDARFAPLADDEPFEVVDPRSLELPPPLFRAYAVSYDHLGFSAALRPWLLRRFLTAGEGSVLYLEPTTEVLGRLADLGRLAERTGLVLFPRRSAPLPSSASLAGAGDVPDDEALVRASSLDPQLTAVGRSGRVVLDWWCERLGRNVPPEHWVAAAQALFPHHVTREAPLSRLNPDPARPALLARFDVFDVDRPWRTDPAGGVPAPALSRHPELAARYRARAAALQAARSSSDSPAPYGWHHQADGTPLDAFVRSLYSRALVEAENTLTPLPPDHWDEPERFRAWLAAPAPGTPEGVSRYLWEVYANRLDLRETFPGLAHDPEVRARYLAWAADFGAAELGAPPYLVPPRPGGVTRADLEAETPAPSPDALVPGVTVAGYLRAELGLGEAARLVVRAARRAGEAVATRTYAHTASPQGVTWDELAPEHGAAYDVNVVVVNGAELPRFAKWAGPGFFARRTTVGLWFWEAERLTPEMAAGFAYVDEVWVTSAYAAEAVRAAAPRGLAVHVLPLGVALADPPTPGRRVLRQDLGLPEGFLFGYAFDYASTVARKNPAGVIRAFQLAFPEPVEQAGPAAPRLVVKTVNADTFLAESEELHWLAGGRPDITFVDETWPMERQHRFFELLDAYVSLHRAEGYGLGPLEALAIGKPVIATDFSGTREFLHAGNSWPVPCTMTDIPVGTGQYPAGTRWAEPDIAAAADAMRRVLERHDTAAVRDRCEQGRADAAPLVSGEAAAAFLKARLSALRAARRP